MLVFCVIFHIVLYYFWASAKLYIIYKFVNVIYEDPIFIYKNL
jgi:hypothetical protein